MSILTDCDPLSMHICIFSAFDQQRPFEIAVVSLTAEQMVQRRTILNKMTECIFNALAFLFFISYLISKTSVESVMLPLVA